MKKVSLKEMFDILIDCILTQKKEYPAFYYRRQNWNTGNSEYTEINQIDLLDSRFITIDGDFSEFEWELEDSNIYMEVKDE